MIKVLLLGATGTAITEKLSTDSNCELTLFARHVSEKHVLNQHTKFIRGMLKILRI